ncbi:glycine zipper domain-containing protein [Roseomonas sp. NAR14]|uniref:Glycine zipper domain-containing protein n=1 Tax=Roseomonas acroporae TaxID=2937791 RepID=A0A9X1YBB6_9PROT|nr:glycine zipper domain-containing protein [Roseomonas acroporae]MCK8786248.1 glycine zipper domain-containing protein [Roseomonas acroporae]
MKSIMTFRAARFALPMLAVLSLGACEGMSDSQRRIGTGAAGGAAIGGIAGSFSGNAGWGALIGAGAGAAGGYLFDQSQRAQDRAFQQGVREGYVRGRTGM